MLSSPSGFTAVILKMFYEDLQLSSTEVRKKIFISFISVVMSPSGSD